MKVVFTKYGAVLAAVVLLLTGCGGGTGGDVPAASVIPVMPTVPAPVPIPVPVEPPGRSQPVGTITLVAGSPTELTTNTAIRSDVDGPGPTARFSSPGGLAVDRNGIVYVADTHNHTIRKIWTDNMVTTFAGGARVSGASDGFNASFSNPAGMSIDGAGNLYVTDGWSMQGLNGNLWWTRVRRISPLGEVATPLMVGNPQAILGPGIAADISGNFYLTTGGVIRKFSPAGVPTNITAPEVFRTNSSIAVDKAGAVYFGYENTVRKIVPGQAEVVLAGSATPGYADGAGTAARFNFHQSSVFVGIIPVQTSMVVDSTGNLYLTDTNNFVIRRITPEGFVSTITMQPFALSPRGLALAGDKTLYVTSGNAVLRIDLR